MALLSYTGFSKYKTCPELYRLDYVERKTPPLKMNTRYFIEGSVSHKCLEDSLKKQKPLDVQYTLSLFDAMFEQVFAENEKKGDIIYGNGETKEIVKTKSLDVLKTVIDYIKAKQLDDTRTLNEYSIGTYKSPFYLNHAISLQGSADWVRDWGPSLGVYDLKTSKTTDYLDEDQLLIYIVAVEWLLKKKVHEAAFLMVRTGKTVKVNITDEKKTDLINRLTLAGVRINEGIFEATPSKEVCGQCLHRTGCKFAYQGRRGMLDFGELLDKGE